MNIRITPYLLLLANLVAVHAHAEETAVADIVTAGKQRFEIECSICHGADARGDGPFAAILNQKPPNLRRLQVRAFGTFPMEKVIDTIDGRDMPLAHRTREMPFFGERFTEEVPYGYESIVRGYILEIVLYLKSIQETPDEAD